MLGMLLKRLRRPRPLGRRGEDAAARYLRRHRYRLLARNLRLPHGEIDLVALAPDRQTVVIVEVKAGTGGRIRPEVHVNGRKKRKLVALARTMIRRNHRLQGRPVRFDVIGVDFIEGQRPIIRHHEGAFGAGRT